MLQYTKQLNLKGWEVRCILCISDIWYLHWLGHHSLVSQGAFLGLDDPVLVLWKPGIKFCSNKCGNIIQVEDGRVVCDINITNKCLSCDKEIHYIKGAQVTCVSTTVHLLWNCLKLRMWKYINYGYIWASWTAQFLIAAFK